MLDESTLGWLRAALEEERTDLRKQIEDLGADPDSDDVAFGSDAGFADRSHSTEERSRTISVVQSLRSNLHDCDRALAKMEAGTYGACESCGKDIPLERLEALPSATLCISCKQRGLGG
jgi:RNA polymerase-binding transcription factor